MLRTAEHHRKEWHSFQLDALRGQVCTEAVIESTESLRNITFQKCLHNGRINDFLLAKLSMYDLSTAIFNPKSRVMEKSMFSKTLKFVSKSTV